MSRNWTERHIRDLVRKLAGTGQDDFANVMSQLSAIPVGYFNELYLEYPIADNSGTTGTIYASNPLYMGVGVGGGGGVTQFIITIEGNMNWGAPLLLPQSLISDSIHIRAGDLSMFNVAEQVAIESTIELGTALTMNKQREIDTLLSRQVENTPFVANGVETAGISMSTKNCTINLTNIGKYLTFTGVPVGTQKLQWISSL